MRSGILTALLLSLVLLTPLRTFAAEGLLVADLPVPDLSEQGVLPEQLANLTTAAEQLEGRYTQVKHLSELDVDIQSSGRFGYRRGGEIHWITERPLPSELIMTPTSIISRQAGQELMHLDTARQPVAKLMSDLFFAVMDADWSTLGSYFSVQRGANPEPTEQEHPDKAQWHVRLIPLHESIAMVVNRVDLSGDSFLKELVLNEANGDTTTIHFSDLKASGVAR